MKKIIVYLIICLFLTTSIPTISSDETPTIEGNAIYLETDSFFLKAEPHTIFTDGWVEFEYTAPQGVDVIWSPLPPDNPQTFQHWNETITTTHTEQHYGTFPLYNIKYYQILNIENYSQYDVAWGNQNNTFLYEFFFNPFNSFIIAFSNLTQTNDDYILKGYYDGETITSTETIHHAEWVSITDTWTQSTYALKPWYILENTSFKNIRFYVTVEGRYHCGIKPANSPMSEMEILPITYTTQTDDPEPEPDEPDQNATEPNQNEKQDDIQHFSPASSWLSDWPYRKNITVTNKIGDYQTFIRLYNTTGTYNCSGLATDEFSDVRFTRHDGTTLIPYFYEYQNESVAYVWINNSYNDTNLYMYYGKHGVSNRSDINATFDYGDDFTTNPMVGTTNTTSGNDRFMWKDIGAGRKSCKMITQFYAYQLSTTSSYGSGCGVGLANDYSTPASRDSIQVRFDNDQDGGLGTGNKARTENYATNEGSTTGDTTLQIDQGYYYITRQFLISGSTDHLTYRKPDDSFVQWSNVSSNVPDEVLEDIAFQYYYPDGTPAEYDATSDTLLIKSSRNGYVRLRYLYWAVGKYNSVEPSFAFGAQEALDNGCTYYKIITITGNREGYQIPLTLYNATGHQYNCSGHANNSFSDIRFFRNDGTTPIDYFIEYSNETIAYLWFNNTYNDTTVRMYYGNRELSSISTINTFHWGDDFTSNPISTYTNATVSPDTYKYTNTGLSFENMTFITGFYTNDLRTESTFSCGVGALVTNQFDTSRDEIMSRYDCDADKAPVGDDAKFTNVNIDEGSISGVEKKQINESKNYITRQYLSTTEYHNMSILEITQNWRWLNNTADVPDEVLDKFALMMYEDSSSWENWSYDATNDVITMNISRRSGTNWKGWVNISYNYAAIGKYSKGYSPSLSFSSEKENAEKPSVTTNPMTGITDTNATLRGTLVSNGTVDTTCYLTWGNASTPSIGNESQGIVADGASFNHDATSLVPGSLYNFTAKANNSEGWVSGDTTQFLTKPSQPTSFSSTSAVGYINVSWAETSGAEKYLVRYRTDTYPTTVTDGTQLCNTTDLYYNTSLSVDTYYFSIWSYTDKSGKYQYSTYNTTTGSQIRATVWHKVSFGGSATIQSNIPIISDPSPVNGSKNNYLNPMLHITVTDNSNFDVFWSSSDDATWTPSNLSQTTGTFYQQCDFANNGVDDYFWKVTVHDDEGNWVNRTYDFETRSYTWSAWSSWWQMENDVFTSVWHTPANKQITLPLEYNGTYNFVVQWGDGTSDTITSYDQAERTHTYPSASTDYEMTISGTIVGWNFEHAVQTNRNDIREINNWGPLRLGNNDSYFNGCNKLRINATDNLNLTGTTRLKNSFGYCYQMNNSAISNWDVSAVTNMQGIFYYCTNFNQNISSWDVSNVVTFNDAFTASGFNGYINNWDVSNVKIFRAMFAYNSNFNKPLNNWTTSSATSMEHMFQNSVFNQPIGSWDTANVTTMSYMFLDNTVFNQDITGWDTGSVASFHDTFKNNVAFNQSIGSWDTSSATDIVAMFYGCTSFNQDLTGWDTGNVTDAWNVFEGATTFNGNITNWDTSSMTNIGFMFRNTSFNQDITGWNTGSVTTMESLFQNSPFNYDIGTWNVRNVTNMNKTFTNGNLNTTNYDSILIGWNALEYVQDGITFNAGDVSYSDDAESAHQRLEDRWNWTILDAGESIDVSLRPTTWIIGEQTIGTSAQNNFTFYQNGSDNLDLTITVNATNLTFVNYTTWESLANNRYCGNFTTDNWGNETSIQPGYPATSILKSNFSPGNFQFGIRFWMPRSLSVPDIEETYEVIITVSIHT